MSRNKVYSIDFMLKIKQVNPDWQFEGKNKEIWEEFIKSQDRNSLLRTIDGMKEAKETKKKKNSVKKVKQVANRKNTESLDYFVKNETKKESDEEL